jgi:hypothetical protein
MDSQGAGLDPQSDLSADLFFYSQTEALILPNTKLWENEVYQVTT